MNKKLDITILILTAVLFLPFTVYNALSSKNTASLENEKRELAQFPELTLSSFGDGSFFSGINSYLSDRFVLREDFIDASKKLELFYGVTLKSDDSQAFVYLGGSSDTQSSENNDDSISQSLANLANMTTAETTAAPETEAPDFPEDTTPEETVSADTASETTAQTPETVETTAEPKTFITLNKTAEKLGIGSGLTLYAYGEDESILDDVKWTFTGGDVLQVTLNEHGGVNITAVNEGKASVFASAADGTRVSCKITVYAPEIGNSSYNGEADFFPSGLFIYGDSVYVQGTYSTKASQNFADIAAHYAKLFPDSKISALIAPCSSIIVDDPAIKPKIVDQGKALTSLGFMMDPDINFVNVTDKLIEHKDEYVYFRSDHHWTMLGAYYAYCEFAESRGFEPTHLEDFKHSVINEEYRGAMYQFTLDERVRSFVDTLNIYVTQKPHTMTVYYATGGFLKFDTCIPTQISKHYSTLIGGDNPYTVINVPENPQDKSILVFKDSFGNAMIPFLCEHYGNIHVVDPRYAEFTLTEFFADQKFSDILFLNNIQSVNSSSWAKLYLKLIGIES